MPDPTTQPAGRLWATAAAVAALGAWVMFDARPGLNWLLLSSLLKRSCVYVVYVAYVISLNKSPKGGEEGGTEGPLHLGPRELQDRKDPT